MPALPEILANRHPEGYRQKQLGASKPLLMAR